MLCSTSTKGTNKFMGLSIVGRAVRITKTQKAAFSKPVICDSMGRNSILYPVAMSDGVSSVWFGTYR